MRRFCSLTFSSHNKRRAFCTTSAEVPRDDQIQNIYAKSMHELSSSGDPSSFRFGVETYPAKDHKEMASLLQDWSRFKQLGARYLDLAWGIGPTSVQQASLPRSRFQLPGALHLTIYKGPAQDNARVKELLRESEAGGVANLFLLRGNRHPSFEFESEWNYAEDLVRFCKQSYGDRFGIGVAGYPHGHFQRVKPVPEGYEFSEPELLRRKLVNGSWMMASEQEFSEDLDFLVAKVEAGADYVLSQEVLSVPQFQHFYERARARGIQVPILPGVPVFGSADSLVRFTDKIRAPIPEKLQRLVDEFGHDDALFQKAGASYAAETVRELVALQHRFIHFYAYYSMPGVFATLEQPGLDVEGSEVSDDDKARFDQWATEIFPNN